METENGERPSEEQIERALLEAVREMRATAQVLLDAVEQNDGTTRTMANAVIRLDSRVTTLDESVKSLRAVATQQARSLMEVDAHLAMALPEIAGRQRDQQEQLKKHEETLAKLGASSEEHTRKIGDLEQMVMGSAEVVGSKLEGVEKSTRESNYKIQALTDGSLVEKRGFAALIHVAGEWLMKILALPTKQRVVAIVLIGLAFGSVIAHGCRR